LLVRRPYPAVVSWIGVVGFPKVCDFEQQYADLLAVEKI
jgi:hypothetical protein